MPCSDCSPMFTALEKLKECKLLSTIRSNHSPFASQRTELNELVARAEKEFVKYGETIAWLQETIVTLENEKENLKGQVQLAKSLMAPIRKLPPEILGKIFMHHGTTNLLDSSRGKTDIPGFKLASICLHWRSVAVITPGLWNNISLNLKGKNQVSYVALMENLLRLSAKSQLNVTITAAGDAPVPACLALLCDQAHRWQTLAGQLTGFNVPLLEVLSSIQRRLDSLQTCTLYAPFEKYSAWVEGARNLHTAGVFDIDPTSNTIPWDQIIDLTMKRSYPPSIAESLANLPNLRSLEVRYPSVEYDDPNYVLQHLHHSSLRSLRFVIKDGDSEINMVKLLEVLVLPKLQSLSIVAVSHQTNQNDLHWSSKELPSLILRSFALITSFKLDRVWLPTSDLIELLRSMSALTTLSISEPDYDDYDDDDDDDDDDDPDTVVDSELLSNLHYHQCRQPILTRLTSLALTGCQLASDMAFMPLFVKVIHSRWKPSALEDEVACIKTVKLEVLDISIPRNNVQTLMMLRTRGLDISVEDKDGNVPLWDEI